MWVPVVAVFVMLVLMGFFESLFSGYKMEIADFVGRAFFGIVIGAIIWVPSALLCLLIERFAINERTKKSDIILLLFIEALIPFLYFVILMRIGHSAAIFGTLLIALLAQTMRWLYLNRKDKLFISHPA
jgi:hypothetical protein